MKAILLMTVREGSEEKVLKELFNQPGIKRAYTVCGAYDIMAVAETRSVSVIQRVLKSHVPEIGYVTAVMPTTPAAKKVEAHNFIL